MTVKLLLDYRIDGQDYKIGNLVTTSAGTEAGLISSKMASSDLTGGTAYVAPVVQAQFTPVMATTSLLTGLTSFVAGGAAAQLGRIAAGTCALLGDSRNDQFGSGAAVINGLTRTKTAVHWLNWYNALNNQPIKPLAKFAVSGSFTVALDNQITSLLALNPLPEFGFIWSGVNDYGQATPAATSALNVFNAAIRLCNAGITPVVFLESGATNLNTSAAIAWLFEFNERLRGFCDGNRRVLCFDPTQVLWEPAGAAWTTTPAPAFKLGHMADAVHPGNLGGFNLGVAFGLWLGPKIAPFESRMTTLGEMVFANNPNALITNALFTTVSGGSSSGAGAITGTVPASWAYNKGASAATATTVTTPAGSHGNDLTLAITTTGADTTRLSQDAAAGPKAACVVGSILEFGVEVVVSAGTNLQGVNVAHEYNDGTASYTFYDLFCQNSGAGNGPQAFTIQAQPIPATVGTTPSGWITSRLEFVFSGAGGATIVIRRAKFRKKYS